jgi:DNA invertase Pin-like site-specific DNA recombinase
MRAVAYLRVSTQDQSTLRQREDIEKYVKINGIELVKVFEDKISGSKKDKSQRIGFKAMEKFIDDDEAIKHILTLEISRLGRRSNEVSNIVQKYLDKDINIHFVKQDLKTIEHDGKRSSTAALIISVMGAMAQTEAELMGQRISSGIMSKARKNQVFGGKIIGYKKGVNGTPIIDEKQAPIIRRAFELAAEGLGMRNISAILESEFDKKMAIGTLSGLIRNSFHKGERKFNSLVLEVPAIVSKELWQKANESIDSRGRFGSRKYVYPNIVQGKITCGVCGNIMHQKVIPSGRLDLFVCKDDKCKNSINRPWLFRMIRLTVERHAQKTKDKQVRKKFRLQITSHNAQFESNTKLIEKINKRNRRARKLYLDLESTQIEYDMDKLEIEKELDQIHANNKLLLETIKNTEKALNNDIEHFSDELAIFKMEIEDILSKVIINKDMVLINIYGWREYELYKPNSVKLGWEARKPLNERYKNETLPLRHPIDDDQLAIMSENEISNT